MTISDLGLYGPDSVTWRIHADPAMGPGGLRALLLQALHPRAMAGVAAHSEFRDDPWGRLFRTADYVAATTYGTTEEAARAAARVRGIHRRGRFRDPSTGETSRLDDPELLLWVHCAEVDSLLSTARRAGLRLTDAEADSYVGEQVRAARLVGLDPDADGVPTTVGELADYFTAVRPDLRLTPAAIEAGRFLAVPPMPWRVRLTTPAVPAWVALVALAFALLPPWARQLYAVPVLPGSDLAATAAARALRAAMLTVPPSLRDGPRLTEAKARAAVHPVRRLHAV
ncbi:MAG TPA: oxygenase MpaB family protein [Mycobacteriales bacterium]|nr:oxygenase MpaB family protein [Mycobacteriales bacterium]